VPAFKTKTPLKCVYGKVNQFVI